MAIFPTTSRHVRATLVRTNRVYPMAKAGMVICFVDQSTMVFGSKEAVDKALDARDGMSQSLLNNAPMMDARKSVDSQPLWSILDEKGTQTMMRQVLGEAGSMTDFDSVRKRLIGSWYGMDFQHGVKFNRPSRRRLVRGSHYLIASDGGGSGPQDERLEAENLRSRRRTSRWTPAGRAFTSPHRTGLQQLAPLAAVPKHGAVGLASASRWATHDQRICGAGFDLTVKRGYARALVADETPPCRREEEQL